MEIIWIKKIKIAFNHNLDLMLIKAINLYSATKLTLECGGNYRLHKPAGLSDMLVAEK